MGAIFHVLSQLSKLLSVSERFNHAAFAVLTVVARSDVDYPTDLFSLVMVSLSNVFIYSMSIAVMMMSSGLIIST
jgi:hypothetical protein